MIKENDFIEIIKQTTEQASSDDVINQLSEIIEKKTSLDLAEAKLIADDISVTIDLIADNFQDLKNAKENGKSRAEWLKDKLDEIIDKYKVGNTDEFISKIKNSLKESNAKTGFDISRSLTSPKYEDLNKMAIVNNIQKEIKNNTLLGAIIFDNGKITIDDKQKEIKAVKDYFEAKLDSQQDKIFKKAVSAATIIGQKTGLLPKQIADITPDEVAMIVDKGVTEAKIAYKLENGDISSLDAVEYVIDRNTVVLDSVITRTCTKVGEKVGEKVGAAIGSIFGPAGTEAGKVIGAVVGKAGGFVVGKMISEGFKKITCVAKSIVKSIWKGAMPKVKRVWDTVVGWFR